MTNSTNQTIDELAALWSEAKKTECEAAERRRAIETRMVEKVGVKDEGVTSIDGDFYKVKITGKLNRSVDSSSVQELWESLPDEIRKCFKWSADLDIKTYRALCSMRTDLLPALNQFITTKPAKPAVTVEVK